MIMSLKQRVMKFKPRIKLNHNIYILDSNQVSVTFHIRLHEGVADGRFFFSHQKFLECIDNPILLSMVIRCVPLLGKCSDFAHSKEHCLFCIPEKRKENHMIKMMRMKDLFMDTEAIIFSPMGAGDVVVAPAELGSRWVFVIDDGKRPEKEGASLSQFLSFSFHHPPRAFFPSPQPP